MKTKYFNDAIIGNKDMLVSLSKTGELLRLYYPMRDNKQYIDFFETGVKINDSMLIYTNNDVNNEYNQKFVSDLFEIHLCFPILRFQIYEAGSC